MKGLKRTLMALLLMAGMVNFANAQSIEDLGNILGGLIGGKNQNGGNSGEARATAAPTPSAICWREYSRRATSPLPTLPANGSPTDLP